MGKPKHSNIELPFSIALTQAELIALIKWHSTQAKRISNAYGKAALQLRADHPFRGGTVRELRALADEAKRLLEEHTTRAKGLLALLPK